MSEEEKDAPLTVGELRRYMEGEPDDRLIRVYVRGVGRKPGTWYDAEELEVSHDTCYETGEQRLSITAELKT